MGYDILILHSLSDQSRQTTIDHVLCYRRYLTEHNYTYHHINAPVTDDLQRTRFDVVIFNYCFLGHRTASNFNTHRARYRWLADVHAVKIGIPQDDFLCNELLDQWLEELGVDVIFSPISSGLSTLYPRNYGRVPFRLVLTGYVDRDQLIRLQAFDVPHSERPIDVGSRVRFTRPHYGRFGRYKGYQAEAFRQFAERAGFQVNMATDPNEVLVGDDWLRFLGKCKFTVGTKGGASLNDPVGDLRRCCDEYLVANPDAPFDEVEAACFAGLDGRYEFSAISPRLFEAAAARTCQILTPDTYVGDLEPYVHYLPLERDLSNIEEVFELMRDQDRVTQIIAACYEALVAPDTFEYKTFAARVLDEIDAFTDRVAQTVEEREESHRHLNAYRRRIESYERIEDSLGPTLADVAQRLLLVNFRQEQTDLVAELVDLVRQRGDRLSAEQMRPLLSRDPVNARVHEFTVELLSRAHERGALGDVETWLGDIEAGLLSEVNLHGWRRL